jgi:hypothetical protein
VAEVGGIEVALSRGRGPTSSRRFQRRDGASGIPILQLGRRGAIGLQWPGRVETKRSFGAAVATILLFIMASSG